MQLDDTPGASTSTSSHPRACIQLDDMPTASASTSFTPLPPVIPTTDETAQLLATGKYDDSNLHGKRKFDGEGNATDDAKRGKGKSRRGRTQA